MMTTLAALLGAIPLMIGFGTGSELRQPLGVAVVGGLLVSQVLTLFSTPVVYLALERVFHRRRTTTSDAGTAGGDGDMKRNGWVAWLDAKANGGPGDRCAY